MKIELPEKVKTVIGELKAHGYDAYAVAVVSVTVSLGAPLETGILLRLPSRSR